MKAFLINTDKNTIEQVEFDGTLDHAYKLLDVSIIERVTVSEGVDLWVDEEGLFTPKTIAKGWFQWSGFPQQLAGRGLITGEREGEEGGEFADAPVDIAHIRNHVVFLTDPID